MLLTDIAASESLASRTATNIARFIGDDNGLSYKVASFIMKIVNWILSILGLDNNDEMVTFLYAGVVLIVALIIGYLFQWIILKLVTVIARRRNTAIYKALIDYRFFHKLCRIVPPLVFLVLIRFTMSNHDLLLSLFTKIAVAYIIAVLAMSLCAVIMTVWRLINARANKRKLPLNGLAQLAKGIVWIVACILIIAIFVDRSPVKLLTGLGAFSAVLMLIFKNNILSVVAGVQLSQNDSLHVGDWIVVDGTNADGTVLDVSLVAVKVLNWDKTTTTLPPYSLITQGFTNYRSMQQSNTRRIKRNFLIDADSVLPTTPQMLQKISSVPMMADYIAKKQAQKAAGKIANVNNPEGLADGTIDTNLGLFRAYMKMWLDVNPDISHEDDCFVTTLAQTPSGIPLQIYCFTATSAWISYEGIQGAVFEHIAAMMRYFGLYTFENPSGRDTIIDGYLSGGKTPEAIYGMPQPFLQPTDNQPLKQNSRSE